MLPSQKQQLTPLGCLLRACPCQLQQPGQQPMWSRVPMPGYQNWSQCMTSSEPSQASLGLVASPNAAAEITLDPGKPRAQQPRGSLSNSPVRSSPSCTV